MLLQPGAVFSSPFSGTPRSGGRGVRSLSLICCQRPESPRPARRTLHWGTGRSSSPINRFSSMVNTGIGMEGDSLSTLGALSRPLPACGFDFRPGPLCRSFRFYWHNVDHRFFGHRDGNTNFARLARLSRPEADLCRLTLLENKRFVLRCGSSFNYGKRRFSAFLPAGFFAILLSGFGWRLARRLSGGRLLSDRFWRNDDDFYTRTLHDLGDRSGWGFFSFVILLRLWLFDCGRCWRCRCFSGCG